MTLYRCRKENNKKEKENKGQVLQVSKKMKLTVPLLRSGPSCKDEGVTKN